MATRSFHIYRFDAFRLDAHSRRLWHDGKEVELPRKVFDCLVYLIENRERAVEHDELLAAVWGDVPLSDHVIAQAVFEARRALGDTGQERRYIKTLRGFGYHWVAPVQPLANSATSQRKADKKRWPLPTLAAMLVLAAGAGLLLRHGDLHEPKAPPTGVDRGEIMLVLPVTVDAYDDHHGWVRLGAMDLVAGRLAAAGQVMVPSDSVIAAVRGMPAEPGPGHLETLSTLTGAGLILDGRARRDSESWHFSLRTVHGSEHPLTTEAEADDILEAARTAADRMALSLGLSPPPAPTAEPGLTTLLQQTLAAMLAQQHGVARDLIEAAEPELRRHPEVRLQMARIELHQHNLDAAQVALGALRSEPVVQEDAELHAGVLLALGWVYLYRGEPDGAEPLLTEAIALLEPGKSPALSARLRSTLGVVALDRGNIDAARAHFAHERVALLGSGDALRMAFLDNRLGLLEAMRERYATALTHFEKSARRLAAAHDVGNELGLRANMVYIQLGLLDTAAARATAARVEALLPQTDNPQIIAWARLTRAYLSHATGDQAAAGELLADVLNITTGAEHLRLLHWRARLLQADIAAGSGDAVLAARLGAKVFAGIPFHYAPMAEERGRAGLITARALLALEQPAAAGAMAETLSYWAAGVVPPAPAMYAALARAEVAAARGNPRQARAAYQHALALADSGQVPLRVLQVAASYTPWLLAGAEGHEPDLEHALAVAGRVAEYADRHYDAALLQLGVIHATGSTSAWRSALNRAKALAGERRLPPEWAVPPAVERATAWQAEPD